MELQPLTGTNLKRYNSMIFAVKEIISSQKIDGHDYLTDTLITAYYGIEDILYHIEELERERVIKRNQEFMRQRERNNQ